MAATIGQKSKATASSTASDYAEIPIQKPHVDRGLLNLPPRPSFIYKWHPDRWGVMNGRWLPILGTIVAEPGVAAVTKDGGTSLAKNEAEKKGWHILKESTARLADSSRDSYVKAHEGRRGTVHMSIFEYPRAIGNRVVIKTDSDAYQDWLEALIVAGEIQPPDEDVTSVYIDNQAQRVERAIGANNPARREREQLRLDEMKAARIPGMDDEPAEVPVKRKPGRPRKDAK